jgi:hypothetical protein
MKILVLSSVRCGGYYFTKHLSEKYNLLHIHEPKKEKYIQLDVPLVTKVLVYSNWFKDKNIDEFVSQFDKIFLLDRRDKDEQLKSTWAMHEVSRNMFKSYEWDDSMFNKDNPIVDKENYKGWLKHMSDILSDISIKINTPVIYYEDLYYNTKNVDLQGLDFNPNLNHRLRKINKKNNSII